MSDHKIPEKELLGWYDQVKRPMLWRETRDPYRIWISEIMLQQTRVDQATPFFIRFMERFPTIEHLANADQHDVLMCWEGLGYYSRARNMHETAQIIVRDLSGIFPSEHKTLLSLKGIGPYTAAAILSIAFDKPYAVVDGNVIRVVTRFLGITDDVTKAGTQKQIQAYVDESISHTRPGDFNQAMMELGATVCLPSNPKCDVCALNESCVANKTLQTQTIPYKPTKQKAPHYQIVVGIIEDRATNKILISKRNNDAMLGGLWEFPGGKQESGESDVQTLRRELDEELGVSIDEIAHFVSIKHTYSHFKITLHAYKCVLANGTPTAKSSQEIKWVRLNELINYPFPKANRLITNKLMNDSGT